MEPIHPTSPAPRRATSYDVARAAGVAQSTVSRCFQPGSNISSSTRNHVLGVAERLNYLPNALARSLITQRSNIVGVIATRYTVRGNPDVIYAISEALAAASKQLLLITAESDSPQIADLRGALGFPLDGLISCVQLADAVMVEIQARGTPLVLYNRRSPRMPVDGVTTDHATAAAAVASALHGAGHRSFVCLCGPPDAPVSRERRDGFLERLAELGIRRIPVIETDYSYGGGHAGILRHLRRAKPPAVIFGANDQIALGVMDACRFELGLAIPADISVVGFDDVAEAARPSYRLTTVRQDSVQMARTAVDILLRRLAEPGLPAMTKVLDAAIIPRSSARLA